MKPHEQRVIEEKKELDEKIQKLTSFCNSGKGFVFESLQEKERFLLHAQLIHMNLYSNILEQRIKLFKTQP